MLTNKQNEDISCMTIQQLLDLGEAVTEAIIKKVDREKAKPSADDGDRLLARRLMELEQLTHECISASTYYGGLQIKSPHEYMNADGYPLGVPVWMMLCFILGDPYWVFGGTPVQCVENAKSLFSGYISRTSDDQFYDEFLPEYNAKQRAAADGYASRTSAML